MARSALWNIICIVLAYSASAQSQPPSDPQALSYAAQSIAALTGGATVHDVTLTGTVSWNGIDTGTAVLKALGTGESRMDLLLPSGTRTEIRDAQTGMPLGRWINPDNSSGPFALQNCQTDAVWFFPTLTSLAAGSNVVLSYLGQETRNGAKVQHLRSYIYQPSPSSITPTPQQLGAMEFYLDVKTLLPMVITYYAHPDNDSLRTLGVEVDFSNYQNLGGVLVPTRIQRYQQGNLMADIGVSGASFNTGLALSIFVVD